MDITANDTCQITQNVFCMAAYSFHSIYLFTPRLINNGLYLLITERWTARQILSHELDMA
jgi:hypothetical protein